MQAELSVLREALFGTEPTQGTVDETTVDRAMADTVVVLPAGGFGYRMRAVQEGEQPTQKCLLPLPGGRTMIDRIIEQYVGAGVRRFVALVNFQGQEVEAHLAGGARWGVDLRCSYDPESGGSGRAGAILHALERGILERGALTIVHNADCQVLGYPGDFARDLVAAHLDAAAEADIIATLLAVDGCNYPYTGMSLTGGRVREVAMYPFIPVPGHAGITLMTAAALDEMAASGGSRHFEREAFARWAEAGRLAAKVISHRHWWAVDDRKAYREFTKALEAAA